MDTISATSQLNHTFVSKPISDMQMNVGDVRHVITDTKSLELSLLIEIIHSAKRLLVRRRAVWPVEVP